MFELMDTYSQSAVIKVLGVGGGGGNAVSHMAQSGIEGVDFICVNTDAQALKHSKVKTSLQIGSNITKGLGAGADPEVGRQAAMEDRDRIVELIEGSDMIFITAGMGGGTGTGAAPIVAQVAKELGILTVAVVTKPFEWEGKRRSSQADQGVRELKEKVDTLIVIPNQRVLTVVGKSTKLNEAFRIIDDVLLKATRGISDLITVPGLVNVDFADVRSVMLERGDALMGVGTGSGENRSITAAEEAIANTLLEGVSIKGAKAILLNISAGDDLTLSEVNEVATVIRSAAGEEANMIFGAVVEPEAGSEMTVTVIATGLNASPRMERDVPDGKRIDFPDTFRKENLAAPTFQRKDNRGAMQTIVTKGEVKSFKADDLDIPTYMRKLMD